MRTQRKNKQAAKSAGKHGQSCDWFVVLYLIGWESHASLRILILFLVPSRMRGVVLKVVEMMGESVLTFKIPIQLLWVLKIYQIRARKRAKERARGLLGSFTNPRGPRARSHCSTARNAQGYAACIAALIRACPQASQILIIMTKRSVTILHLHRPVLCKSPWFIELQVRFFQSRHSATLNHKTVAKKIG